jgi:hypothetical protein
MTSLTYTGDYGYVAGAEVEYRKQLLIPILTTLKKLSAGLNASYLYSNQELNADKQRNGIPSRSHKTKGKFTGASDLLLNADLTFFNEWNDKIII